MGGPVRSQNGLTRRLLVSKSSCGHISRKCSTNVQQLELPEELAEAHPYREKQRRHTKEEKEAADLAVAEALLDKAAGKKVKVAKTVNKLAKLHKPVDAVDKTP